MALAKEITSQIDEMMKDLPMKENLILQIDVKSYRKIKPILKEGKYKNIEVKYFLAMPDNYIVLKHKDN
jgi:hypothetical protein